MKKRLEINIHKEPVYKLIKRLKALISLQRANTDISYSYLHHTKAYNSTISGK